MRQLTCPFCGGNHQATHVAREMMFGTREAFTYLECAGCGSLWLADVPADLGPFYPPHYYSFREFEPPAVGVLGRARLAVFRRLVRAELGSGTALDRVLVRLRSVPEPYPTFAALGIEWDADVLDVGTGNGQWLRVLRLGGMPGRLLGIDPYLAADRKFPDGVAVLRASLEDIDGQWDLIAFHHVLEHLPDPVGELVKARSLLAPGGRVLVRVPTCSSAAWDRYGTDWVQLDPPRHLVVPSRPGLAIAAERAGLRIVRMDDDSTALQFWGSERYRSGRSLVDVSVVESDAQRAAWDVEAGRLNVERRGDQVAYWLAA